MAAFPDHLGLDEKAAAFCVASVSDWTGRAPRPGPDGLLPAWLAAVQGRSDLEGLLGEDDADAVTETAGFVGACMRGDRAAATRMTAADPALPGRPTEGERAALVHAALVHAALVHAALVHAAEAGNEAAVSLMLDIGFPVDARRDDGATALHAAAYAGSVPVVRLLLSRGADLEALDGNWQSPPLGWAVVGSGQRPTTSPHPDWIATVRALIEAGASTACISLSPDDPKPPSAEVADLLRTYGVGSD
jgi:hypothetical protein